MINVEYVVLGYACCWVLYWILREMCTSLFIFLCFRSGSMKLSYLLVVLFLSKDEKYCFYHFAAAVVLCHWLMTPKRDHSHCVYVDLYHVRSPTNTAMIMKARIFFKLLHLISENVISELHAFKSHSKGLQETRSIFLANSDCLNTVKWNYYSLSCLNKFLIYSSVRQK